MGNFYIRPDGKEIAFTVHFWLKPAIWMMENVFAEKEKVESGKK
ncbi:MAG: hypothetical protein WC879_16050 [Melioribacteraceae bacterium]